MRLQLTFHTSAREIPWDDVLRPGRALIYTLLETAAPQMGSVLHKQGFGPTGMVPFSYSAPVFPAARKHKGIYAAGGPGTIELGSPLTELVEAWAVALRFMPVIAWGATAFTVDKVEAFDTPDFSNGRASFRTSTPVVMKSSGRNDDGSRTTRQAWCLPGEPEWDRAIEHNLRRKAETLGMDPRVSLDRVTWVGAKRSFAVGGGRGSGGRKPGACVEVEVSGEPKTLQTIHDWGVGQANSAGYGWISR